MAQVKISASALAKYAIQKPVIDPAFIAPVIEKRKKTSSALGSNSPTPAPGSKATGLSSRSSASSGGNKTPQKAPNPKPEKKKLKQLSEKDRRELGSLGRIPKIKAASRSPSPERTPKKPSTPIPKRAEPRPASPPPKPVSKPATPSGPVVHDGFIIKPYVPKQPITAPAPPPEAEKKKAAPKRKTSASSTPKKKKEPSEKKVKKEASEKDAPKKKAAPSKIAALKARTEKDVRMFNPAAINLEAVLALERQKQEKKQKMIEERDQKKREAAAKKAAKQGIAEEGHPQHDLKAKRDVMREIDERLGDEDWYSKQENVSSMIQGLMGRRRWQEEEYDSDDMEAGYSDIEREEEESALYGQYEDDLEEAKERARAKGVKGKIDLPPPDFGKRDPLPQKKGPSGPHMIASSKPPPKVSITSSKKDDFF